MHFYSLAQSHSSTYGSSGPPDEDVVVLLVILVVIGIGTLIVLAIQALICWLIWRSYKKVPPEFQVMKPGMVWLLMVPLFSLVWTFFVAIQIPDSFKAYFDAIGDQSEGDAGKSIGLAWAICTALAIIPYLGACIAIGALVCMIIFIVKISNMAKRIPEYGENVIVEPQM